MRVIYRQKNFELEIIDRKGKLYVDQHLRFMGDSYVAIKMLLNFSENHPDVRHMFRLQLAMREKPSFKSENPTPSVSK